MANRNAFLQRQEERERACIRAGLQCGRQQILDCMSMVLHDPAIMGKDVFGTKRLLRVVDGIKQRMGEYNPAFQMCDEADYYQEKMDAELKECYGELHNKFSERYSYLMEQDYRTGKWKF